MTDVVDRFIDQGLHLFVGDVAGTGCQAVQVLDQIVNGSCTIWLAFGGPGRKGHDRYMFLIRHFPAEQTLDGVSCRLAQFVGPAQPSSWLAGK